MLRIYMLFSSARRREANQALRYYETQEILNCRRMPEGVDISSITCLEDIESCLASIEQEEVSTGCYGFMRRFN